MYEEVPGTVDDRFFLDGNPVATREPNPPARDLRPGDPVRISWLYVSPGEPVAARGLGTVIQSEGGGRPVRVLWSRFPIGFASIPNVGLYDHLSLEDAFAPP